MRYTIAIIFAAGSPVRAGVDLVSWYDRQIRKGFPRSRGGRPAPAHRGSGEPGVPPFARG